MMVALPECDWEELLNEVLTGNHFLPHWLDFEPYLLALKLALWCLSKLYGLPANPL